MQRKLLADSKERQDPLPLIVRQILTVKNCFVPIGCWCAQELLETGQ
jgi:hypothetical protein